METEEPRCSICKTPWHPATGHYISARHRWCGPCTRSWVKEVAGMQKRTWGGVRFYDHARVPPPAMNEKFTFFVDKFTPESKTVFSVMRIESEGVNYQDAYLKIADRIPEGHRVWSWIEGVLKE